MENQTIHIQYMALSELQRHPRNPKDHDKPGIARSIRRFGFVSPILVDERTQYIVAGHGRLDTTQEIKDAGEAAPKNVVEKADDWFLPVVRGVSFNSDAEVEAYLIADNQLTILGGWNDSEKLMLLQELQQYDKSLFEATGYNEDDVDQLMALLTPDDLDELTEKYGDDVDDSRLWPVIRYQVSPETFQMWTDVMAVMPQADDEQKIAAMLGKVLND